MADDDEIPVEKLVLDCMTKNETWKLLSKCKTDTTKQLATSALRYMNSIAGSFFAEYDPQSTTMPDEFSKVNTNDLRKQLVKLAFSYRRLFELDLALVDNCVFVRKMNYFIRAFEQYKSKKSGAAREIFFLQTFRVMTDNDRLQYAIINYMNRAKFHNDALLIALKMKVPMGKWPPNMIWDDDKYTAAEKTIEEWNQRVLEEQEQIKDGFNLLSAHSNNTNMVRVVDSDLAVQSLLEPFIKDAANKYFGFDSEWDMSFWGEMGDVCLIQMSSATQTMLIDIFTLKNQFNWTEEKFMQLFKLIFDHDKKIYGFGYESDMKTLASNFPLIATELLPKLSNLVCLYNTAQIIKEDDDLSAAVFGDEQPTQLNLALLSKLLTRVTLDKQEQEAIWSSRPLRKQQQMYAARDSYIVIRLQNRIAELVTKNCPTKLDLIFKPYMWTTTLADDSGYEPPADSSDKRKTKASHIDDRQLMNIIQTVNEKLKAAGEELSDPQDAFYITDTMCGPLGGLLRRLGISAFACQNDKEVLEMATKNPTSKVLTSGRGCKKYPCPDRILNIDALLAVDRQLMKLLYDEKLRVTEIKPRCVKCNSFEMVFIPVEVMRYIHVRMAIVKEIDIERFGDEDMIEQAQQLSRMSSNFQPNRTCLIGSGKLGLLALTSNAIIYLDELCMHQLKDSCVLDANRLIKLHPTMKEYYGKKKSRYVHGSVYAICWYCGKENFEFTP